VVAEKKRNFKVEGMSVAALQSAIQYKPFTIKYIDHASAFQRIALLVRLSMKY